MERRAGQAPRSWSPAPPARDACTISPLAAIQASALVEPRQIEGVSDEDYAAISGFVVDACAPVREIAPHVAGYVDRRGIFADAGALGVCGCAGLPLGLFAGSR
jgi:hypothetical protein